MNVTSVYISVLKFCINFEKLFYLEKKSMYVTSRASEGISSRTFYENHEKFDNSIILVHQ